MPWTLFRKGRRTTHYSRTPKSRTPSLLQRTKTFFHTIPLSFARHHGAIVFTLRKPNRADLLRRLTDALVWLGERDLRDTVWLVTDTRIRSRHA
jgi:hypothetical protein